MKTIFHSEQGFTRPRLLLAFFLCIAGALLILVTLGILPGPAARAQGPKQDAALPGAPDVVSMIGPVSQDQDLRTLPYFAPTSENDEVRLMRNPPSLAPYQGPTDPIMAVKQAALAVAMPIPIATYPGISSAQSGCGCLPPDTHGDVGMNHYIQSVNSSIKILDKSGNQLVGPTTYNSFFQPLVASGTPCGTNNDGDGFVFYDHLADRWVVSDFAFANFPGVAFYQCIGVSKTSDPVAGGWYLYALQVDSANPTQLGDYPKFALWPDAYYLTVNLFSNNTTFNGVRVFALNRAQMINGTGAPTPQAIAYTIDPATLGDSYSLVPATFRTGNAPPLGRPEYLMAIDSPADGSTVLNKVYTWRFHVDFTTPANSTFGVGANHAPNGFVTVSNFNDAFQGAGVTNIVPQKTTTVKLDTLGDKIMTPLVYQNLGGTESLWASHSINNNVNGTGPTAVRWYQFITTGDTIPATPAQQQTFNNGSDGLWRWMPSIALDSFGNMSIGFTESSSTTEPTIAYAGRLAGDPANTLGQGEAVLIAGGGHQTSSSGRWGDYSSLGIDPADNHTFWHTNEYYSVTSSAGWNTRIGKYSFAPSVQLAFSRKSHSGVNYDIPLPLTGSSGVECRRGSGVNSNGHQVIVTFANPVTVGGVSVTSSDSLATATQSVSGNTVTIDISTVANAQTLSVKLTNVNDGFAAGDVAIPVGILLGDTNGDRFVNSGDALQTRNRSGQTIGPTNYRSDVNTDGIFNSGDTIIVRGQSGAALPSAPAAVVDKGE